MPGIIPHDLWLLRLEPVHVTSECPGACDSEDLGPSGNRDACWRIRWASPKHVSAGYYYRIPVPINLIGHPRRPGAYPGQVMVGLGKEGNTMKKLALLLCAVTPFAIVPLFAAEGRMTADERAYLLDQLETSKKNMLASIQGVTAEQWKFK